MAFIVAHKVQILAALLAISEVLDAIPGIEASSIWKAVYNTLKSIAGKSQ